MRVPACVRSPVRAGRTERVGPAWLLETQPDIERSDQTPTSPRRGFTPQTHELLPLGVYCFGEWEIHGATPPPHRPNDIYTRKGVGATDDSYFIVLQQERVNCVTAMQ